MPIATVNGVNLAYVVQGRGTPLVAMHGFAHSTYTWEPVMDALAGRCQVFAYDHRGHGASGTSKAPYDIPALADDLLGLLNFWGLDRVHLMGHSMGGRTALWFALQHPEKLESLMLVGASAAAPEGEARERWETLRKIAREEGVAAMLASDAIWATLPKAYTEGEGAEAFRKRYLRNTPAGCAAAIDAILQTPDMRGRLGEIRTPTWVCAGERDAGPMAFGEMLEERIPDCVRTMIPACGHYPMQEATEAFAAAFEAFIDAVSGAHSQGETHDAR